MKRLAQLFKRQKLEAENSGRKVGILRIFDGFLVGFWLEWISDDIDKEQIEQLEKIIL